MRRFDAEAGRRGQWVAKGTLFGRRTLGLEDVIEVKGESLSRSKEFAMKQALIDAEATLTSAVPYNLTSVYNVRKEAIASGRRILGVEVPTVPKRLRERIDTLRAAMDEGQHRGDLDYKGALADASPKKKQRYNRTHRDTVHGEFLD